MTLWQVRIGQTIEREQLALSENIVFIGWESLPNLENIQSKWCIHQINEYSLGGQSQMNDEGGDAAFVARRKDDDGYSSTPSLDR